MTEGTGISPDFLSLIQHAATEVTRIPLPSKAKAIQLRQRIHSARKQLMRAAQRPNASSQDCAFAILAETIETSIEAEGESYFLVVRPKDSQFRDALRSAGVPLDQGQPTVEDQPVTVAAPSDPISAYLKGKE